MDFRAFALGRFLSNLVRFDGGSPSRIRLRSNRTDRGVGEYRFRGLIIGDRFERRDRLELFERFDRLGSFERFERFGELDLIEFLSGVLDLCPSDFATLIVLTSSWKRGGEERRFL